MGDWSVTVAEVLSETGVSVSESNLSQASSHIEIFINATPAVSAALSPNDLHWVQTAIKWQAAWLKDQYDITARNGVRNISQDGVSAQFQSAHSLLLSPFASRTLKNISFMGWRTIRRQKYSHPRLPAFTSERHDQFDDWDSL